MYPFVGPAPSAIGNSVAEGQETVGEVDILKFYVRARAGKLHICKVPEASDTHIDEMGGSILGHRLGNGQDHHVHTVAADEIIQLCHGIDGYVVDDGAGELGIDVKGGVHSKAGLGEGEILQQGMAQVAYSDHNEVMVIVHSQDMADFRAKLLHIVAVTLLTELAKAAEVLPDLRGGDIHLLAQRVGRDPYHAAGAKVRQLAVITGEAPDDSIGDILLFQCDHSYKHEPQGSLKIS